MAILINDVTPYARYTATAGQTLFTVPFEFFNESDLIVLVNDVVLTYSPTPADKTQYSVTGANQEGGGSITLGAPGATLDDDVVIYRAIPIARSANYPETGPMAIASLNTEQAKHIGIMQQLQREADRALLLPLGEAGFELPAAADRASKVLAFDANGDLLAADAATHLAPLGAFGVTLVANATAADARADLAVNSVAEMAASGGSALSGFIQSGTGAAAETVQTANRRTIFAQQYSSFQAAHDAHSTSGNLINVDVGTLAAGITANTRKVGFKGKGIGASILNPASTAGIALRAAYTAPSWDAVSYESFSVTGTGTRQGVGFKSGPDAYSASAEYIGRNIFERVKFDNLEKCIERPFGNIGLWVNRSQFEAADYHIFTKDNNSGSGDPMHAGNTVVRDSHFQNAQKAAVYIEGSTTGSGQVTYQDCIFETNPGYVFYIDGLNSIDGQPGLNVFNCWNEGNYTAGSVTVEGDTATAVYARISNSPANYFHDTPIGPLRLVNSNVLTNSADLSRLSAITTDALSTVVHDNARLFSGTAKGLVRSIGGVVNYDALNGPAYPMPLPRYMRANLANVVRVFDAQSVFRFTGSVLRDTVLVANDPALPAPFNSSQTITINNSETLLPQDSFTVPAGKWLVWQYIAKIVSGPSITVNITGSSGVGGTITIEGSEWRCYTVIFRNTGGAIAGDSFYHYNAGATTVVGIGGLALLSFDSAQAALDYANSGAFPYISGATVASAATITLPTGQDVITITGTTGITSISASAADAGRRVTLIFADALTVTDGSNLKLNANFTTTADDTLTLVCDGTNWFEVGRSTN